MDTFVAKESPRQAGKTAGMDVAAELDALEIAAKKAGKSDQAGQAKEAKAPAPAEKKVKQLEKKHCPRCSDELPADLKHFYRDKKSGTGLSSWCKVCTREASRKYEADKAAAKIAAKTGYSSADNNPAPSAHPARAVAKGDIDPALEKEMEGVMILDFSARPGLLDRIEKAADRQYRIPEQQIMFWAEMALRVFENLADNEEMAPFGARKETT